jgi:hypothetical protein
MARSYIRITVGRCSKLLILRPSRVLARDKGKSSIDMFLLVPYGLKQRKPAAAEGIYNRNQGLPVSRRIASRTISWEPTRRITNIGGEAARV